MSAKKIAVVGAGHVGATCSQLLSQKELAREVILIDIAEGIPQGKALDQWESAPIERFDSRVSGTNDYESSAGAEIFIVTAGIARKPGMSRDDLLKINAGVIRSVSAEIKKTKVALTVSVERDESATPPSSLRQIAAFEEEFERTVTSTITEVSVRAKTHSQPE